MPPSTDDKWHFFEICMRAYIAVSNPDSKLKHTRHSCFYYTVFACSNAILLFVKNGKQVHRLSNLRVALYLISRMRRRKNIAVSTSMRLWLFFKQCRKLTIYLVKIPVAALLDWNLPKSSCGMRKIFAACFRSDLL